MPLDPVTAIFEIGKSAIDKIWPDADSRMQQLAKLEELKQAGDLQALNLQVQLMLAQIDVNKTQAQHKDLFVAGARPAIIWMGAISLGFTGIVHQIAVWVAYYLEYSAPMPKPLDVSELMFIVASLLGVAGMRSVDKFNGVETNSITKKR